jgi:hypothetical protein
MATTPAVPSPPNSASRPPAAAATRSVRDSPETTGADGQAAARLLVRVLDRGPHRGRTTGTSGVVRRLLGTPGRQMGCGRTPHDLTSTRPRRFPRGLGLALQRPYRDQESSLALRALHGDSHPDHDPGHMGDPTSALRAARTPTGRRTSTMRIRVHAPHAPHDRLSYNLLHGFKAARSAHRPRLGPRPGLRSCLRPAPARPAPVPRAQQSAT